jgi:hypothetical protein
MRKTAWIALFLGLSSAWAGASMVEIPCAVRALAISPLDPDLGIVATAWGTYRSQDGERWAEIPSLADAEIAEIVFHPTDEARIYLGTLNQGLLVSTDRGVTWAPMASDLRKGSIIALALDPQQPDTMYAGLIGWSVFKSTDAGRTWKRIYNGIGLSCPERILVAPWDPRQLYVASGRCSDVITHEHEGVFISENAGEDWDLLQLSYTLHQQRDPVMDLAAVPTTSSVYIASWGHGLLRSDWSPIMNFLKEPQPPHQVGVVVADPSVREGVLLGAPDGLWRRSKKENEKLSEEWVSAIGFSPKRPESLWFGTPGGALFHSLDRGKTWRQAKDLKCPAAEKNGR